MERQSRLPEVHAPCTKELEQLFAAGYACFIGAIKFVAGSHKIKVSDDIFINSSVSFGPRVDGAKGFSIDVTLTVA